MTNAQAMSTVNKYSRASIELNKKDVNAGDIDNEKFTDL